MLSLVSPHFILKIKWKTNKQTTKAAAVKFKEDEKYKLSSRPFLTVTVIFFPELLFMLPKTMHSALFRIRLQIVWSCFVSCSFDLPGHGQQSQDVLTFCLSLRNKINQKNPKHTSKFQTENELMCFAGTRAQPIIQ